MLEHEQQPYETLPPPVPEELVFRSPFRRPGFGTLRNILATIVVGLIIAAIVWFADRPGGIGASQSITLTAEATGPAPRLEKEAPDFSVRTLDGKDVSLSDLRGKPVWVSFWASWCPPCRAENPDIEQVYQERKAEGLVIVGISIGESTDTVKGYIERTGLSYTIGLDQSTAIAARYRIVGIPTHFFIDRDGVLREWRIGSMSKKMMDKRVDQIMSATPGEEP